MYLIKSLLTRINWPRIIRITSYCIFILIISYLIYRAYFGLKTLLETGGKFSIGYLFLSLVCQVVGYFLAAALWSDIIAKLGVQSDYWFDFQVFSVSAIGRKIPGIVIYALGRLLIYNAVNVSKTLITIGIVIEMVINSLSGLVILIPISSKYILFPWLTNPAVLLSLLFIFFLFIVIVGPKLIFFVLKVTKSETDFLKNKGQNPLKFWNMLRWIITSVIIGFFSAGVVYFICRSIQGTETIPFDSVLNSIGYNLFIGPLSVWLPSDIGLRDGILYFNIKTWIEPSFAALLTLASRVWISIMEIGIGITSAYFLNKRIKLRLILKNNKSSKEKISY